MQAFSIAETAAALHLSIPTVKTRLLRARLQLRESLSKSFIPSGLRPNTRDRTWSPVFGPSQDKIMCVSRECEPALAHRLHMGQFDDNGDKEIASGAKVDANAVLDLIKTVPAEMRNSMQKDVEQGKLPELDLIAGPILRGAQIVGIVVPRTKRVVQKIEHELERATASKM